MTTIYRFKAAFTKSGDGYSPTPAPTLTVVDSANNVLVNAAAVTALTNLAGVYIYEYSGADGLDPVGRFRTTDATVDEKDLYSYTPFNLDAAVSSRLEAAGYTAPANADVAAIKAKTDNLPAAPAATGDIPTASVIATAVWSVQTAVMTVAGSIGKALAGLLAVFNASTRTLTMTSAQVQATIDGDDLEIKRGDTFSQPITGLGSMVGRTALYFTIKSKYTQDDDDSTLQMSEIGGLIRLNGQEVSGGDTANASLVVNDEDAGDVTITIKPGASYALPIITGALYDIQMHTATTIHTVTDANVKIIGDVTRRTS